MNNRLLASMSAAVIAVWWLAPASTAGQAVPASRTPTGAAKTSVGRRTPDGQPDLQGMWLAQGMMASRDPEREDFNKGAFEDLPDEKAKPTLDPKKKWDGSGYNHAVYWEQRRRTELPFGIVDPPDGKIPFQPWAAARAEEKRVFSENARSLADLSGQTRCLLGLPFPMNSPPNYNGLEFLQSPGLVLMIEEWNHLSRTIPLDGRPRDPNIRLWMGDARGHWEGHTLVVDVTNFLNKDVDVIPQSDAKHLVERFTIVDADTIAYEVTIEDPKVFTRPWKVAGSFTRAEKGYELFEYACHEGNRYSLEGLLRRR